MGSVWAARQAGITVAPSAQASTRISVSFMVNGLNLGNATGSVADLTPMIQEMMGQTTVFVNGLNLGNLKPAEKGGSEGNWHAKPPAPP